MATPDRPIAPLKPCFVMLEPVTPKMDIGFSEELKNVLNERNMLTTKTRKRMTEALDEIHDQEVEDKKNANIQNILTEILTSEENYIKQLEVVINFFMKPIQQKHLLSPEDFDFLFGSIKSIYVINKELLDELRNNAKNVARAFSRLAPFFKMYSFYAFEFKDSLRILQNCQRDNPKFAKFLELQETRPEVQSKLSALLIAPIQRVPRYKLLLESLCKLTSPTDRQYMSLYDSLRKVGDAAEHINKIIKERENMQRLIELQRCLQENDLNIITPGRHLTKEGTLMRISNNKSSYSQKTHVVLTNDIIIFCKIKKEGLKVNSLKCSGIYPLNKCRIMEILDKGSFRLICQEEEIVLYHKSFSETRDWIECIKSSIQTLLEDRKTLRKENSARRPVKRKNVNEYNEIGISPGRKLKKKRSSYEQNDIEPPRSPLVKRRRPLRFVDCDNNPTLMQEVHSKFNSLKPKESNEQKEELINQMNEYSKDVFVFGKPNPDRRFSFKMNQWFCGIGSTMRNLFGFK